MKKILSLFLALIMVMSLFNGVTVSAENADAWMFSKTEVSAGEEFTMTLIMPETLVISSMGFTLNFDNKAFEIIRVENVPYTDIQPNLTSCNNNANIYISYCDPTYDANTEIVAGTELLNVTFKTKEDATLGDKTFEVYDWCITGMFNEETFTPFDITPDIGERVKNVEVVDEVPGEPSEEPSEETFDESLLYGVPYDCDIIEDDWYNVSEKNPFDEEGLYLTDGKFSPGYYGSNFFGAMNSYNPVIAFTLDKEVSFKEIQFHSIIDTAAGVFAPENLVIEIKSGDNWKVIYNGSVTDKELILVSDTALNAKEFRFSVTHGKNMFTFINEIRVLEDNSGATVDGTLDIPSEEPSEEIDDSWGFDKTEVVAGEEFVMTLTMPETLTVSSLTGIIEFDNRAFEIINIENLPYADMQPNMQGCNNNANIGFSYCDPTYDANTEIVAGTELLNVTFRVKDDAELGNKIFEVRDWNVTGEFNEESFMPFDITPDIGKRVKNVEIVQDNEWVFSKTQVEPGDEFTMDFKMPETLTVSSLGLIIQFDNRAFEIINIENLPYADMQPSMSGCNNNANIGFSYVDPTYDANTEIVAGTELLNVTFKAKDDASLGDYAFKIYDWTVTGAFNEETFLMDDIAPELSTREVIVTVNKQKWAKNAITFDKENAPINRTFKMIFTQPETVLASSLGLNIGFDNEAFEIVEVAEAPYAALQPDIEGCNNAGNVAISWVDPTFDANTTIEEGTVLLEVTFFVKEGTPLGVKNFDILDYNISGEFKGGSDIPEDVTPCIASFTGSIEVVEEPTYTVSGSIRSFGVSSKAVKIELLNGDKIVNTKTITGNDVTYTFDKVKEGDYTVRISKSLHASREYDVSVYGKDVTLNGEIWLYGDVNTDGYVNNIDILQIDRKVVNSSSVLNLEENKEYRYKVANVTAITGTDTAINNLDILQINRKIVNLSSVIDRTA